jgi:hypothetical protein
MFAVVPSLLDSWKYVLSHGEQIGLGCPKLSLLDSWRSVRIALNDLFGFPSLSAMNKLSLLFLPFWIRKSVMIWVQWSISRIGLLRSSILGFEWIVSNMFVFELRSEQRCFALYSSCVMESWNARGLSKNALICTLWENVWMCDALGPALCYVLLCRWCLVLFDADYFELCKLWSSIAFKLVSEKKRMCRGTDPKHRYVSWNWAFISSMIDHGCPWASESCSMWVLSIGEGLGCIVI